METSPRTSPWPLVMGIIIISLGAISVLFMLFDIAWVAMFDVQKEMMTNVKQATSTYHPPQQRAAMDAMQKMFDIPGWYKPFAVVSALLGVLVRIVYTVGGIMMVMRRHAALAVYFVTAALIVVHDIIRIVAILMTGSLMLISNIIWPIFGIFAEITILVLVGLFVRLPVREYRSLRAD